MRHTDEEIEHAGQRFEQLADELDPATVEVERIDDLRQIAASSETIRA
ncbi:MAG: sigma-70 family RNA polymerase sigma factor, partial [Actinophytocola sp.]|nr:sigma-70 family RNA polymerase sigma factor [Actinophytocola sp.]